MRRSPPELSPRALLLPPLPSLTGHRIYRLGIPTGEAPGEARRTGLSGRKAASAVGTTSRRNTGTAGRCQQPLGPEGWKARGPSAQPRLSQGFLGSLLPVRSSKQGGRGSENQSKGSPAVGRSPRADPTQQEGSSPKGTRLLHPNRLQGPVLMSPQATERWGAAMAPSKCHGSRKKTGPDLQTGRCQHVCARPVTIQNGGCVCWDKGGKLPFTEL